MTIGNFIGGCANPPRAFRTARSGLENPSQIVKSYDRILGSYVIICYHICQIILIKIHPDTRHQTHGAGDWSTVGDTPVWSVTRHQLSQVGVVTLKKFVFPHLILKNQFLLA